MGRAALRTHRQSLEDFRTRNKDANHQQQVERQQSLLMQLEQERSDAAKAESEKLERENCAKEAAEHAASEQQNLEATLRQVRAGADETKRNLILERKKHEQSKKEHAEVVEEARRQLDDQRNTL